MCLLCAHHPSTSFRFPLFHHLSPHSPPAIAPSAASSRWTITVRGSKTVSGSSTTSISLCKVTTRIGIPSNPTSPPRIARYAPCCRPPKCALPYMCQAWSQGQYSGASPRRLLRALLHACAQTVPPDAAPVLHHPGASPRGTTEGHHPRKDRLQCFIPVLHTGGALPTLDISASLGGPKSQGQRILLGPMLPMLHDEVLGYIGAASSVRCDGRLRRVLGPRDHLYCSVQRPSNGLGCLRR